MIRLKYIEDGEAVTEFNYERWIEKVLLSYDSRLPSEYLLCTEIPFLAVRKEIAEGRIKAEEVTFIFDDKEYQITEEGDMYGDIPYDLFEVGFKLICAINRATRDNLPRRK